MRHQLDITRDLCPMTFVKTKLELEELAPGDELVVLLREGEPLLNVGRSVREDGHEVLSTEQTERPGIWRLTIRRS
jgi:tRNA 2-thiouridine synthesizing protein A